MPQAIHDAFVKLLPHPAVKSAPPSGHELINVEALLWLDTTKDLNLGTTAIQGHNITLTATISDSAVGLRRRAHRHQHRSR